jgi:hypothetical protein
LSFNRFPFLIEAAASRDAKRLSMIVPGSSSAFALHSKPIIDANSDVTP